MASSPRWLDVVRHRVRGLRVPYLLVLQHHEIPAATLLAAPVSLRLPRGIDAVAPRLIIGGTEYRARILDMSAIPRGMPGETVRSAFAEADAIMSAIDIIPHGYPAGRPN